MAGGGKMEAKIPVEEEGGESLVPKSSAVNEDEEEDPSFLQSIKILSTLLMKLAISLAA